MKCIFIKTPLTILFLLLVTNIYGQDLANKIFKSEKYQKQLYKRYPKKIEVFGDSAYIFGDKFVTVSSTDQKYLKAFSLGIFNPDIIFGATYPKEESDTSTEEQKLFYNLIRNDSLYICCFRELEDLNINEQTKRFQFWHFRIGFFNPTEYYIEFYNEKAIATTTTEDFFENATMSFYRKGGIIR